MSSYLRLLQLADSALPISGYTHSWGLEAAIAGALVNDPESLERWTRWWLRTSLGPLEGVLVVSAFRAAREARVADLCELNAVAHASIVAPSIRSASREMGEQLLALARTWAWSGPGVEALLHGSRADSRGWHHPVVFGMIGAIAGAERREVVEAYLHQSALGMVTAGVRAVPVGHTHGQQAIAYLHDVIAEVASRVVDAEPDTAGAGCPFYETLCDEQTQLYARMFRS